MTSKAMSTEDQSKGIAHFLHIFDISFSLNTLFICTSCRLRICPPDFDLVYGMQPRKVFFISPLWQKGYNQGTDVKIIT